MKAGSPTDSPDLLAPVWGRPWNLHVDRALGVHLWDEEGERYLDFTSGIGVTNTGHCHPRVVEAIREQAERILHAQANILFHGPMRELAQALTEVVPEGLNSFFFSNSGAEAVEAAIKLARQATGRPNIIAFEGGFHGRTIGTMSLTSSKEVYRAGYQPLMPGVFFAPFAGCHQCPKAAAAPGLYGKHGESCCGWPLERVREMLRTQTAPEETAAVLVEPIQGEGGFIVPDSRFLAGLREICDEHGMLLILDEVQSGFGRTGRFFALEHFDVVPDILVMAKGMASGMPLSGIAAPRTLMERWRVGAHGGTYGGNAVSCAAAVATLEVIRNEGLVDRARHHGSTILDRLRALQARHAFIGDVRGKGLMIGVEMVDRDGRPDGQRARSLQGACHHRNLLLLTCGARSHVIRWLPPLVVEEAQVEEALRIFTKAVDEAD